MFSCDNYNATTLADTIMTVMENDSGFYFGYIQPLVKANEYDELAQEAAIQYVVMMTELPYEKAREVYNLLVTDDTMLVLKSMFVEAYEEES